MEPAHSSKIVPDDPKQIERFVFEALIRGVVPCPSGAPAGRARIEHLIAQYARAQGRDVRTPTPEEFGAWREGRTTGPTYVLGAGTGQGGLWVFDERSFFGVSAAVHEMARALHVELLQSEVTITTVGRAAFAALEGDLSPPLTRPDRPDPLWLTEGTGTPTRTTTIRVSQDAQGHIAVNGRTVVVNDGRGEKPLTTGRAEGRALLSGPRGTGLSPSAVRKLNAALHGRQVPVTVHLDEASGHWELLDNDGQAVEVVIEDGSPGSS